MVTTAKTSVRAEVSARSRGLYDVTFVPSDALAHFINITFNEAHIRDSPFKCEVVEGVEEHQVGVAALGAAVAKASISGGGGQQEGEQQVIIGHSLEESFIL